MSKDVTPKTRVPLWVALVLAMGIGALTAIQARINGQLGQRLENGMVAAFVSFASGFVLLVIVSMLLPVGRRGFRALIAGLRAGTIPWWMVLGGVAGAVTVATQGLTVAIVGVSLFTVGVVAGQAVCGLIVDRVGYGPAGVVGITLGRLAGGALALAAVAVSLTGDLLSRAPFWMLLLPFGAGIGIAWQQATNGHLRVRVGTPLTATLVNFTGGTVCLGIGALISLAASGPTRAFPTEPWLYLGGSVGVIYIFMSAALVSRTGVLLLGLGSVVGQIVASVIIDALWPAQTAPAPLQAALMVTLALASVVVATVPWHRLRRRPRH